MVLDRANDSCNRRASIDCTGARVRDIGSKDQGMLKLLVDSAYCVVETSHLKICFHRNISHVLFHRICVVPTAAPRFETALHRTYGLDAKDLVSEILEAGVGLLVTVFQQ
jgi:hypothetical protein